MSFRTASAILLSALLTAPLVAGLAPQDPVSLVPAVAEGFVISPLAALAVPTAIDFGPDGHLYATTLTGDVQRVELTWTPAGPAPAGAPVTVASGFSQPLGIVVADDGAIFVADSVGGVESGRIDGRVSRVDESGTTTVVEGLPNGRHNTNNLRFGPDGRLYIANGNPNDSGQDGDADVFPYSGAILSVDADEVTANPAVLHWRDVGGAPIAPDAIATHPRNADFAAKVDVLGWGFRNVYDVAFDDAGNAYTATNGADVPSSQDLLYKITPGADHGFPFCYNVGTPGATGDGVSVVPNPLYDDAERCADAPAATALLGWHVCATGMDVSNGGAFGHAAYVGECGPFYPDDLIAQLAANPEGFQHNEGHKIARVMLDDNGDATEVRDFITGLALPLDVEFGPDGAMYVADAAEVLRVAPALPSAEAAAVPEDSPASVVLTGPQAAVVGYTAPVVAVPVGGSLTHVNADLPRHDVIAVNAYGPDDQPWCNRFSQGQCPLFWSPLIGIGGTSQVLGLENLEPLTTYEFTCSIHAGMVGTLVALPATA